MSVINPSSLTLPSRNFDAPNLAGIAAAAPEQSANPAATKQILAAAQQFEAIFLRQILSTLERGGQVSGDSKVAGSGAYGSLMVEAFAEHTSSAGGLGLADLIVKALMPPVSKDATSDALSGAAAATDAPATAVPTTAIPAATVPSATVPAAEAPAVPERGATK